MSGPVHLQGGREMTPGCEDADAAVLAVCEGPVVVLAGAARVGSDYAGASQRATDWFEGLGATVIIAPDPREDREGALAALGDVGLLFLPGGSPASLRQVLNGPVGDRVIALQRQGAGISGASAGAMVLCQRTVLPSQGNRQVDGLGIAPGVALVHWGGPTRDRPPADGMLRWGLPERGGALIVDGGVVALGQGEPSWQRAGRWSPLPRDLPVPLG
jgi:putative intracellular protease/amidase